MERWEGERTKRKRRDGGGSNHERKERRRDVIEGRSTKAAHDNAQRSAVHTSSFAGSACSSSRTDPAASASSTASGASSAGLRARCEQPPRPPSRTIVEEQHGTITALQSLGSRSRHSQMTL